MLLRLEKRYLSVSTSEVGIGESFAGSTRYSVILLLSHSKFWMAAQLQMQLLKAYFDYFFGRKDK